MNFIVELEQNLRQKSNRETAIPMENYMKNNFSFLGIKTEERRSIFKECCDKHKLEIKSDFRTITWELFNKKEREFHITAIDLICKEIKNYNRCKNRFDFRCKNTPKKVMKIILKY